MAKARLELSFSIKQAVLKYLCDPQHSSFLIYCNQHTSIFGGPSSSYRPRARKFLDDTRRRHQNKNPVKFAQLLKHHNLDSSGNSLDIEAESYEADNISIGSDPFSSPSPPQHSKMYRRTPPRTRHQQVRYEDEVEDDVVDEEVELTPVTTPTRPTPRYLQKGFARTGKFSYHCI
jgi:hypothetical protein